jgi:hypothetical protein
MRPNLGTKGTIRSDIRYRGISKDVRRHRLITIGYIATLPCHGRGRGFESRPPRYLSKDFWLVRCQMSKPQPRPWDNHMTVHGIRR